MTRKDWDANAEAKREGISKAALYKRVQRKRHPHERIGKKLVFDQKKTKEYHKALKRYGVSVQDAVRNTVKKGRLY